MYQRPKALALLIPAVAAGCQLIHLGCKEGPCCTGLSCQLTPNSLERLCLPVSAPLLPSGTISRELQITAVSEWFGPVATPVIAAAAANLPGTTTTPAIHFDPFNSTRRPHPHVVCTAGTASAAAIADQRRPRSTILRMGGFRLNLLLPIMIVRWSKKANCLTWSTYFCSCTVFCSGTARLADGTPMKTVRIPSLMTAIVSN